MIALALLSAGCGEIDGSKPFAGVAEFEPSDRAYHMRFLSPPWLLIKSSGEVADLAVAPSELSADIAHATVTLHVAPVGKTAQAAAEAALAAWSAAHAHAQITMQVTPIANSAGQMGVEFAGFDPDSARYHREAFFDAASGAFALSFDGSVRLDVADVTDVVAGFVPKGKP